MLSGVVTGAGPPPAFGVVRARHRDVEPIVSHVAHRTDLAWSCQLGHPPTGTIIHLSD